MNILVSILFTFLLLSSKAYAKDEINEYDITPALDPEVIGNSVSFYFGNKAHPQIKEQKRVYTTLRRANAVAKSKEAACIRAFQSALIALRDSAVEEGANAVVNIRSHYKSNTSSSETQFKCSNGHLMAAVGLKGDAILIEE